MGGAAQRDIYVFRGMIFFNASHYVAAFWCWTRMSWIFLDDAKVEVESNWDSLVNRVVDGQYVPTLLFYERVDEGLQSTVLEEFLKQIRDSDCQNTSGMMDGLRAVWNSGSEAAPPNEVGMQMTSDLLIM